MSQTDTIGKYATAVMPGTFDEPTKVRYHHTVVVSFTGTQIVLGSGGWRTMTTKLRMNQTSNQYDLGFGVFQKDFEWFVNFKGETLPFTENMVLTR